jgi:hypothetical protein
MIEVQNTLNERETTKYVGVSEGCEVGNEI